VTWWQAFLAGFAVVMAVGLLWWCVYSALMDRRERRNRNG
jgi:hypothetical protein